MRGMMRRFGFLLLLCLSTALFATASSPVDAGKSQLLATFTQMSVPVDGEFRKFSGQVSYDAATPDAAHAELIVDTASFDIGDDDYNAEVRKAEWFDSARHPNAVFKATGLARTAKGYEARGTLTLKGRQQALTAPITIEPGPNATTYRGTLPISRKAFAIGDPVWEDTVEDTVQIRYTIVVPKAAGR